MKTAADLGLAEGETMLSSFEPNQENLIDGSAGVVVKEHATQGQHALRLVSKEKDYTALSIDHGPALRLVRENSRLLVDVFNPQDRDITIGVLVRDPRSKDFVSRYNDSLTIKPGRSTIDLDYTRLPRWASRKDAKPDLVDPRQITLMVLFLEPSGSGKPVTLFLDKVRLAAEPRKASASSPPGKGP